MRIPTLLVSLIFLFCEPLFLASQQAGLAAPQTDGRVSRPNIVLILIDDLGPEWIGAYGGEGIETPNIDKLAAGGMKFTNAYSMPQCTPTRATLLTGQYPFRHGWVNHWDVPRWGAGCHFDPSEYTTFARLLRTAGYRTAIAGKWQINDFRLQPRVLDEHGFDEWSVWTGFETGNPPSAERYWDPYIFRNSAPSRTYEGKFGPDLFNEFLIDFFGRHKTEPMLLYYPLVLTHSPMVHTPHEPEVTEPLAKHKAMVRYTDHLIGRLVQAIEDAGLRERTIIFLSTDNGTARGITGRMNGRTVRGGKATLTENGVRAPFIVNGPGTVPAGVTTNALTDFTDLLPTFLELAGVETPKGLGIDGKSIAGVILGEDREGPREWVLTMGHGPARLDDKGVRPVKDFADRAVRDQRYKIHVLDGKLAELYDLKLDPGEERNLIHSAAPEHLAARKRLSTVVETFPKRDARPRYTPLPPQPWDIRRAENEHMWKSHE